MGIAKLVGDAIDKMDHNDHEGALFQICAAIEATAKKEYNSEGRNIYKKFVSENFKLITRIAFEGRAMESLRIQFTNAPQRIKSDANGMCDIQDIFYHAVRCGLYHDASLPSDVRFTDERQFRCENGGVVLPFELIYGFILAVVVAPVNCGESVSQPFELQLPFCVIPVNSLWGRRTELTWLLDSAKFHRRPSEHDADA